MSTLLTLLAIFTAAMCFAHAVNDLTKFKYELLHVLTIAIRKIAHDCIWII